VSETFASQLFVVGKSKKEKKGKYFSAFCSQFEEHKTSIFCPFYIFTKRGSTTALFCWQNVRL